MSLIPPPGGNPTGIYAEVSELVAGMRRRADAERRRDAWLRVWPSERVVSHTLDDDGRHCIQLFDESQLDRVAIPRREGELLGIRVGADYWDALDRALVAVGY